VRLPRLIATDLDGTLVGRDDRVSPRNAAALAAASAAGAVVVLVTGRPVRWLSGVYAQLAAPYPAICANGAVDYDPALDLVHESRPLPPTVLAQVCTRLATAVPGIRFAAEIEGGRKLLREAEYSAHWDADAHEVPLSEIVAQPAVKLLARAGRRDPDEFAALVGTAVDGLAEVTHSSTTGLVEISATGVTKATGLAALSERLGIAAADVLAFGDMPNDVTMLRWAGCGIAVANAHPAARAAADGYTLSNVDDGVAVYLEGLLTGTAPCSSPAAADRPA
jgi:Cof subfamily protein (haloacid dehalogenase superfamily)